jgi:phosphoribosylformylglycinamidine synthase
MMRVRNNGSVAAEILAKPLADEAPLYSREARAPVAAVYDRRSVDLSNIDPHDALRQLLRDPNIASKNWVYRQYDHTVRAGAVVKPGSDAGVFFVRYANKILAATTDCNSLYCRINPREGARIAVAEAARNLTCSGARPLAATDNLNFGNPYKPENFWQLREAVEGMAEACRAFGTPITGGNVSLYNESPAGVVDPTPTVGMVGLIEAEGHITTQWFKNTGDVILLVGERGIGGSPMGHRPAADAGTRTAGISHSLPSDMGLQPKSHRPAADATTDALGGSRFLKLCFGLKQGPVPSLDLNHEIAVQEAVRMLIREGLVRSAHDCSEGGLAVALAECCFNPQRLFGANITKARSPSNQAGVSGDLESCAGLFGEAQSRIIISAAPDKAAHALQILRDRNVPYEELGHVSDGELAISFNRQTFRWPVADLYDDWWNSIRRAVEQDESIPSL